MEGQYVDDVRALKCQMEVVAMGVEGRLRALVCRPGLMMTVAMIAETEDIMLVTAHVAVGAGCIFFHIFDLSGVYWMYLKKSRYGIFYIMKNMYIHIIFKYTLYGKVKRN